MVTKIVDIDSHILEPADLWEKNLEPRYRDQAIRLLKDEEGLEYFEIAGKKSFMLNRGTLGLNAAVGQSPEALRDRFYVPGKVGWEEGRRLAPGSKDAHQRIQLMDEEGVDMTFLYPTVGLSWEVQCEDPKLAAAYCRAYNDWVVDFCKPYPQRLMPIAHVSLLDVNEAVQELRRAAKMGMKGVFFNIWPPTGRSFGDTYYDPLWAEALDCGITVSLHVFNGTGSVKSHQYPPYVGEQLEISEWFSGVMGDIDVIAAFTSMLGGGTLDRFPDLKIVMLEIGCGWVANWLDRMDTLYERVGWGTPMKLKPSEYFSRQCYLSMEPDERSAPAVAQWVGADKILWASDYPHSEGHAAALTDVKKTISPLPEEDQRKILGENALSLYGLS